MKIYADYVTTYFTEDNIKLFHNEVVLGGEDDFYKNEASMFLSDLTGLSINHRFFDPLCNKFLKATEKTT
jgi:hypothetical protein